MDEDTLAVLTAYPQIYFPCHKEHRTRARSSSGLTSREAGVLAHIGDGVGAGALARHLGVAPSSLSAMLRRLSDLGLIEDAPTEDARQRHLRLNEAGRTALAIDGVLDAGRVTALLNALSPDHRKQAVEGLAHLARAARVIGDFS